MKNTKGRSHERGRVKEGIINVNMLDELFI
jgi:hypothetical protein